MPILTLIFFMSAASLSFAQTGLISCEPDAQAATCGVRIEPGNVLDLNELSDFIINPPLQPPECSVISKTENGEASFYGCRDQNKKKIPGCRDGFHGRTGFCGVTFLAHELTIALPQGKVARPGKEPKGGQVVCGSIVKLTNPENGKVVYARVMDTGGFAKYGRVVDVSGAIAGTLGFIQEGHTNLQMDFCGGPAT